MHTIRNLYGGYVLHQSNVKRKKSNKKITGGVNKTSRRKLNSAQSSSSLATAFLSMLNTVKLYHWKTTSYAQHVATDELYLKLNKHIDKFMEVYLGKEESRIKKMRKHLTLTHPKTIEDMKIQLYGYRDYLIDMNKVLDPNKDTDLLNVRDEILADINQVLYLFTFK